MSRVCLTPHINARHPSACLGAEECFRCFLAKTAVSGLEVEVLQGLDGVVGVTPAAGGVVEGLVGEEVLIGGVGALCVVGELAATGVPGGAVLFLVAGLPLA